MDSVPPAPALISMKALAWSFSPESIRFTPISAADDSLAGVEEHLPAIEEVYRELAQHEDGVTPQELAEELGKQKRTVQNQLTALLKQGRAETLAWGKWVAR